MKYAQNLKLWLFKNLTVHTFWPLLQISTITLSLPVKLSYIHTLPSTNIIVKKLARPDTGITDKITESSTLKFMVMII